ncbi:MAG TPA: T9SS type A sorting domain-containing protein [Bacteroidales bacterium]|nr:T9SS type A sorting domain-containing protein [Bacteroidales bacterium]
MRRNIRESFSLYSLLLSIAFVFTAFLPATAQVSSPSQLHDPWAGGLNSCQFCNIDINLDGTNDLLIFDRHGNRILPYLQTGWGFRPAPETACLFPDLHDWVITSDYNCDGKMDLFTYSLGGVRIFQNTSDTSLKFTLVTDMLTSYYYNGYVGILVTPVDYPAIADIDGDGDLDLLTFFGLGSYIEYHKNLSIEKYGICDSLDFRLADHCWGNFKESEGSNRISLGIVCPYKYSGEFSCAGTAPDDPPKHTGSTILATDLNGDGVKDLLLGDVDFPALISLINGGTLDSANMISMDTLYPSHNVPVNLFSFPAASMADMDRDGITDLLVSPFDPNLTISENRKSIWYYKNYGTNGHPDFRFVTNELFQQDMLDFGSASYPVLFDLDGDGQVDLLTGSYGAWDSSWYDQGILHSTYTGTVTWFRNTGNSFDFVTADLGSIASLSLRGVYPAFGDITGDGYPDMVLGNSDGTLLFFANSGVSHDTPAFLPPVFKYMGIDAGDYSAPQLFDLDNDGLTDLIIGERSGNLNFYRNTGTLTNPVFTFVTDSLGKINVTNPALSYYGYSTPCFFRDSHGKTWLVVGSEEGKISCYQDIDNNLSGAFSLSDSLPEILGISTLPESIGWRTAPAIGHITGQENMDLITGNFSGGLNYFSSHTKPGVISSAPAVLKPDFMFSVYPNPASSFFRISLGHSDSATDLQVDIFNITGMKVFSDRFSDGKAIEISSLTNGIYLVRISGDKSGPVVKPLVIVH